MTPPLAGILGVVAFLVLMAMQVPIAVSMVLVGLVGFSYVVSPASALSMLSIEFYSYFSSYYMVVIPLFVWMGFLAYYSGIASNIFEAAHKMMGGRRGSLAMATQVACAGFGAICGSSLATAATIGAVALPEMKKYHYDPGLATASVAAGSVLGGMIPPSTLLMVYGIQEQLSIGKLFIAGVLPGILLMFLYIATIAILLARNPSLASAGPKVSWSEKIRAVRASTALVAFVFVISMGGLFAGFFTPTEAASVGAFTVLIAGLATRRFTWRGFCDSVRDTTKATATIMFLVAGAMVFTRFLTVSKVTALVANWASGMAIPPYAVLAVIYSVYIILGLFIEGLPMILLTVPIFYPVVTGLGYDPIWFGIILLMLCGIGGGTPPVGMLVFVVKGIAPDVPLETIYKGMWPFLIALAIAIVILTAFPIIATFLPQFITY